MINIPFFGHTFVFSILAISVERGGLLILPSTLVALIGAIGVAVAMVLDAG